ncbi:AAA family ATPase [Maribellus maritimus]|uniref:AAA family ATPase n=1 Tax=Maribellus maritimus TaxID=2870838 RepID=UPI001EEA6FFB|nr:AAA family ATPase [Maribellus maritimus]MCG6191370.1 AAA family ATPase [Maribellus maritimus]
MIKLFIEKFQLSEEEIIGQAEACAIANCIPQEYYESVVNLENQDVFKTVEEVKDVINEEFVDSCDDLERQEKDLENIVFLLELIQKGEIRRAMLSEEIYSSKNKAVQMLCSIIGNANTEARFCDLFTADSLKKALAQKPKKLLGKLLFEGTNTILFADNGVGKTLLSMILADKLAKGEASIFGLEVEEPHTPRIVLYYDFEMSELITLKRFGFATEEDFVGLSDAAIKDRLPHFKRYDFETMRKEFIDDGVSEEDIAKTSNHEQILIHIDSYLERNPGHKIVTFIDNLSALGIKKEDNSVVGLIMGKFTKLKQKYGSRITNVMLAHTPKVPREQLLVKEHLQGAKAWSNLADEVIGLKQSSQGDEYLILKQLKGRIDGVEYGEDNVLVFKRYVNDSGVLTLDVVGTDSEYSHTMTEEARKKEIENANSDLYDEIIENFNKSFDILDDFPDDVGVDEREPYIFNVAEIAKILLNDYNVDYPARLLSKALKNNNLVYKPYKIGNGNNKKGFILERINAAVEVEC